MGSETIADADVTPDDHVVADADVTPDAVSAPRPDNGVAIRGQDFGLTSPTTITGNHPGMIEPGNIDLTNRPDTSQPDGSHSSVRSASYNLDGKETLLPTISDDGRQMNDDEAIAQYRKTGKHLGKFANPDAADAYGSMLHEQQEGAFNSTKLGGKAAPSPDVSTNSGQSGPASPTLGQRVGSVASAVAQPFVDIGKSLYRANKALVTPSTYTGAGLREGMRGVNSNIPFANDAVEAIGGPPAQSAEDAAAAPGANALGSVAGSVATGEMGGKIAGKVLEGAMARSAARTARGQAIKDAWKEGGAKAVRNAIAEFKNLPRDVLAAGFAAHEGVPVGLAAGAKAAQIAAPLGKAAAITADEGLGAIGRAVMAPKVPKAPFVPAYDPYVPPGGSRVLSGPAGPRLLGPMDPAPVPPAGTYVPSPAHTPPAPEGIYNWRNLAPNEFDEVGADPGYTQADRDSLGLNIKEPTHQTVGGVTRVEPKAEPAAAKPVAPNGAKPWEPSKSDAKFAKAMGMDTAEYRKLMIKKTYGVKLP